MVTSNLLPRICDVVEEIEAVVMMHPDGTYGPWEGQSRFCDEILAPWTQVQWSRYDHFLRAGRDLGLFPSSTDSKDTSEDQDELPDFSRLAMKTAKNIRGYNTPKGNVQDIRALVQEVIKTARVELEEFFAAPSTALEHVQRLIIDPIRNEEDDPDVIGEKAATEFKRFIDHQLSTMSAWSEVSDLLDQIDWTDQELLMRLASDPYHERATAQHSPLVKLLQWMESKEGHSALRLSRLHEAFWKKARENHGSDNSTLHRNFRTACRGEVTDSEIQIVFMERRSVFEKAVTRVCRPSRHAGVPFQIALLDLEQLLIEKPGRGSLLSSYLMRAIGHHALVVEVHAMMREYIHEQASKSLGWEDMPKQWQWGKGRSDSRVKRMGAVPVNPNGERITVEERRRLQDQDFSERRKQGHMSGNEQRMSWMSWSYRAVNWAYYLTLDPITKGASLDSLGLLDCLNCASYEAFKKPLLDVFDSMKPTKPTIGLRVPPDFANDSEKSRLYQTWIIDALQTNVESIFDLQGRGLKQFEILPRDKEVVYDLSKVPVKPTVILDNQSGEGSHNREEETVWEEGRVTIAIGGHAYQRDNGLLGMPRPSVETNLDDAVTQDDAVELPSRQVHAVTNKQVKLVERIFGLREGDVPWSKFVILMRRCGYSIMPMGGTAYHIKNSKYEGTAIVHRPHPNASFSAEQARNVGVQLSRAFGLSVDNFARSADGTEEITEM